MLAAAKYGTLNAVVRCRAGRLLATTDYHRLLDAATPAEQVKILQDLGVPVPADGISPIRQFLIKYWLAPDYEILLRRVTGCARNLIQSLLSRFELENIKYVLRAVINHNKVTTHALLDLGRSASLRASALVNVQGLDDLQKAVKGTVFDGPIRTMAPNSVRSDAVFPTELALDRAVYCRLWSQAQEFKGSGATNVRPLFEKLVQSLSLLWVVRYRQSYGLSGEAAFGIVQVAQTFWPGLLKKIVEPTTFDGLRSQMTASHRLKDWANGDSILEWEASLWRRVARAAKRALYGPPFDMAVSLGFLLLKELAIRDIATICQSKILRVTVPEVRPLLIHLDPLVKN